MENATDRDAAPEEESNSVLAAVYQEFGFANQMYDLVMRMKRELDGVGAAPDGDAAAAARLVHMEREAGRVLRRAVETETRLMTELNRQPTPPEPKRADAPPADAAGNAAPETEAENGRQP